jgi:hypothetical protein
MTWFQERIAAGKKISMPEFCNNSPTLMRRCNSQRGKEVGAMMILSAPYRLKHFEFGSTQIYSN